MRLIAYPETYDTPSKIQLFHPRPHCSKFDISIPLTLMLELPRRESRSEINWVPPLFLCPVSRFGGLGHYIFSRSAISSTCIAGMLLLATSGAQGLYSGTSQCGSHPGGLVFTPPAKAHRRRSLMDTLGQHAGTG